MLLLSLLRLSTGYRHFSHVKMLGVSHRVDKIKNEENANFLFPPRCQERVHGTPTGLSSSNDTKSRKLQKNSARVFSKRANPAPMITSAFTKTFRLFETVAFLATATPVAAFVGLPRETRAPNCGTGVRLGAASDACDVAVMGGGFGGLYTALAISREAKKKGKNLDESPETSLLHSQLHPIQTMCLRRQFLKRDHEGKAITRPNEEVATTPTAETA